MIERNDEHLGRSIAFVTHTRPYRSSDVLPTLARYGFTTTERPHDRDTERLLSHFEPSLAVLAIDPRREDDIALVRSVSHSTSALVLVIAPGPGPNGVAAALDAGADICVRDTDGLEVLTAQVGALARRKPSAVATVVEEKPTAITVRDLTLDFDRCQIVRDEERIALTPTEFKILAYMAKNAGKVVSPVEILRSVQDYTYSEREAQEIVKVYIRRIRRKIEHDPSDPNYIINVRGFGYMLERRTSPRPEVQQTESAA